MMHRGRQIRTRIFLGCQGDSERSYGTFLHRVIEHERRLHIDAVPLQPGAGDPLATIERAVRLIRQREQDYGSPYKAHAILMDRDQWGLSPERDRRSISLANDRGIQLIWQSPCHESFLLHHIIGCSQKIPCSSLEAMKQLRKRWPDYQKGVPSAYLETRLDLNDLKRACSVEAGLYDFLNAIKFFTTSRCPRIHQRP